MKKCKLALLMISCFFLMSILSSGAMAKDLSLSSWLPAKHHIVTGMIQPWLDDIKRVTDGRVSIKILAKGLGHPKAHFDIAKNGLANVAYSCNVYIPGRFSLPQAVELPFLGDSAEAMCVAYWRTYKKYFEKADEYKGAKLMSVFVHGPGQIHNSKKPINSVADLKGMKFRIPGGIAAEVTKALGVVGIQKPASKSYEILSRGVADGIFFPKSSIKAFKITKLVPYTTLIPGGLYNTAFFVVMNKDTFNGFSAADQKAIMSVSGEVFAKRAGRVWDDKDTIGLAAIKAEGNKVQIASADFIKEIKIATKDIESSWIKKAKAKGVDGAAALKYFRAQVASYDVIR
jgi:TRAP-type C4-dicarboxylate transport system substrate-binding protein